jgi:hypothetical protein
VRKALRTGLALALLSSFGCSERARSGEGVFQEKLGSAIRQEEVALHSFAVSVREHAIQKKPGRVTYAQGALDSLELGPRIHDVTMDDNGNVYFILDSSWVTLNEGFVLRNGAAQFLGDQQEPEIRVMEKLFGEWWFYRAS